MRVEVDSGGYVDACTQFYDANHGIVTLVSALAGSVDGGGGMAGTDTGGAEFAAQYDQAAGPLLQAGCDLGQAMAQMGNLLNASLVNHQGAEYAAQVSGSPTGSEDLDGDTDPDHYGETLSVSSPPSAAGGTGDQPGWWHWIASHVEGLLWPDADTGRLRSTGDAWVKAGNDLTGWTYAVDAASGQVSMQRSPEVPDVTATCSQLNGHIGDLSHAYVAIGNACTDYADQVDAHHREVEDELASFLEWTAAIEGGGALLAVFTVGISEAAAQAAEGAEVANAATKVIRILNDLIELARLGVSRIREAVEAIARIGTKIKAILTARVVRAMEKIGVSLRKVDLDALPRWADGGEIPTSGAAADLYRGGIERYGGLSRQKFYDKYWDEAAGSWKYPPDEGFAGAPVPNSMRPGDVIDRIGATTEDRGVYASPADTPYGERAIPPSSIGHEYHQFEVIKPLPESVTEGKIAPWFEQPGGGVQFKFDRPMMWYVKNGYLRELP